MQTVHLNIAWLPRTLRFTWSNVLPLKRSAYLSDSNLGRTAEVTRRMIRCLVSKPDETLWKLGRSAKTDNLYSRSGRYVTRAIVLF